MGHNISAVVIKSFGPNEEVVSPSRRLADYTPASFLGSGSFGAVFKCHDKESSSCGSTSCGSTSCGSTSCGSTSCGSTSCVAVKVMKGDPLGAICLKWRRETSLLQEVRGEPFVLQLLESFVDGRNLYCLVTEFASSLTLGGLVLHSRRLEEAAARFYLAELAIALEVLHKKHIVHMDVKVDNVLLDREGHILLADFGEARKLSSFTRASMKVKTFMHINSEGRLQWKEISYMTDWKSYAVTAHYIATRGKYVFGPALRSSLDGTGSLPSRAPDDGLSAPFRDLLRRLVSKERKDRLGRRGVDEIKGHPFFETIDWTAAASRGLRPPTAPAELDRFNVEEKVSDWTTDCVSHINLN